jgi:glycosyltransferase involved in cell wall biosynthesis
MKQDNSEKYSVVLRVRNEERWVGYALQSIVDHIGESCEIIIVNNGTTDDSIRIVNLFEYLDVKKVDIPSADYPPGKALNLGIKNASRERILILSAHCQINSFNSDFLDTKFKDNSVACIFGKQTPYYLGKQITPRYMWSHFDDIPRENYFSEMEDRYFLHNGFALYRTEVVKKYPFDNYWAAKEDRYWAQTIVEQNVSITRQSGKNIEEKYKFLYEPSLKCLHHYTSDGNTWKGIG